MKVVLDRSLHFWLVAIFLILAAHLVNTCARALCLAGPAPTAPPIVAILGMADADVVKAVRVKFQLPPASSPRNLVG